MVTSSEEMTYIMKESTMNNLPVIPKAVVADLINTDIAFYHSVKTRDVVNMQMVLRAHGFCFSSDCAEYAIFFGELAIEARAKDSN